MLNEQNGFDKFCLEDFYIKLFDPDFQKILASYDSIFPCHRKHPTYFVQFLFLGYCSVVNVFFTS